MLFRSFLFVVALTAATPMTAQIIEDISMLTSPSSSEPEAPAVVLPELYLLNPQSLVVVTWTDNTTSSVTVSQLLAWYQEE